LSENSTTQCFLFPDLFPKPVVVEFDQRQGSSDGGAILLKAADRRLQLTQALAVCLVDKRQAGKVDHEIEELLRQRVYGIACGYADANDAARLAEDPVHKMLLGRDPVDGPDLASQPTLCRFENSADRKQLYRMGEALAERVIERHRRRLHGRARRITIDLDPTDDPTHGAQQLTFFNSHYDTWCYLPVAGFVSFNDEQEQYLVTSVLRPGNAPASAGAIGILRRILKRVGRAFPKARIRVRLDGGFADPQVLAFLDARGVEYVVAMAKNAVLNRLAEPQMQQARQLSQESGRTEHVYGEGRYAAQSWLAARDLQGRGRAARGTGSQRQPALRDYQLEAESAVDLRAGLLRARRHREPHQGTAPRPGDRPHQLHEVLGQPVPGADDGGCLCADAGTALAGSADRLCAGAGRDPAGAVAEAGGLCGRLGAPGGDSSSRLVSVSRQLPQDRPDLRCPERIACRFFPEHFHRPLHHTGSEQRCPRNRLESCPDPARTRKRCHKASGGLPRSSSSRVKHLKLVPRYLFMNKAG
jgi:hypothetical protein